LKALPLLRQNVARLTTWSVRGDATPLIVPTPFCLTALSLASYGRLDAAGLHASVVVLHLALCEADAAEAAGIIRIAQTNLAWILRILAERACKRHFAFAVELRRR
jgi:hypothetical protein